MGVQLLRFPEGLRIRNNTPINEGNAAKFMASPAQMFFSRRTRTDLPTLSRHLMPVDTKLVAEKKLENAERIRLNRNLNKTKLKPLSIIDGGLKRRNRSMLKPRP